MKKKNVKKKTAKRKKPAPIVVSLKIDPKELKALKARAQKFAKGNLSAWFRYTGLRYVPKKTETIEHCLSHLPAKRK